MLNLKLRDEFSGSQMPGTVVRLEVVTQQISAFMIHQPTSSAPCLGN